MKDEELIKITLDLQLDNIRQYRELFKHVAILSSAIIGVFAFNGNQHIDYYAKIGVGGLFFVIFISVLLIFLSLWEDKKIINRIQKLSNNVRKLKEETKNSAIKEIVNDENITTVKDFIRKIISEEDLYDLKIEKINFIFGNFWAIITANDQKIEEEKSGLLGEVNSKRMINLLNVISISGIIVFFVSLGIILLSIMLK